MSLTVWIVPAILVLAALWFLMRPATRTSRWMQVQSVDGDGRVISSERVRIKEPDRYESDGASHLCGYVESLVASTAEFTALSVFTTDETRGFLLHRRDGVELCLVFDGRRQPEREETARAFFRRRGIEPAKDYVGGNGDVPDALRILSWPIEGDAEAMTEICHAVLTELCGVALEGGLKITYEEHKDRRGP